MKQNLNQNRLPFVESLETYKEQHMIPFHTPGHKIGVGAPTLLTEWMGKALSYDLGLMYAIDDYHEPERELLEAQQLAAQVFGADHTWFSINGTSGAIQMMMMSAVKEGDSIIIPREAHCSVHNSLVLSGAKPIYMRGCFHPRWGIPVGVTAEEAVATMEAHPEAKAILLVHPNYYGIGVDVKRIVEAAHQRNMLVLVDEAHGPHLVPSLGMPVPALESGADLVAQSTHKLLGSLTQTSMLHGQGSRIDVDRIQRLQQILMSTSPNYIFLASLDMARHQWATEGQSLMEDTLNLARTLRSALNEIHGIACPGHEDIEGAFTFDETKIIIDAKDLGLTAQELEKELRQRHIEVELMKAYHVLLLITIGDTDTSIQQVIDAVQSISDMYKHKIEGTTKGDGTYAQQRNIVSLDQSNNASLDAIYSTQNVTKHRSIDGDDTYVTDDNDVDASTMEILPTPIVLLSPRQAFYAEMETILLKESLGRISGETITYYPPGIPCLGVGEVITEEVLAYIEQKQRDGYVPNGATDRELQTILVCKER
ncbi:aminotransferase class I/II-fold pyridoxal phosphate-dependent enzyme [Veillonella sp. VA142]|uniref:aminotransferase class I/II-fold pyridoxal phosphate-dependent enzyme n=1 Tax=Veillonella sp. VA142 TaxID=741834 RepID=UPI000F8D08D7|nr:aminotransferase class I/II-fold pyridoxal phosphate-dependent enzyme [Veillonella sp. VA142]